jgi:hypothetical protein
VGDAIRNLWHVELRWSDRLALEGWVQNLNVALGS